MYANANLASMLSFAREQGRAAADGEDAIFHVASRYMIQVHLGAVALDDAEAVYTSYAEGRNSSGYARKIDLGNAKSIKVQASKLRSFAKLRPEHANLPDVVLDLINDMEKRPSVFESMYKVNTSQVRRYEEGSRAMLSKDEIAAILAGKPKADPEVSEFLSKLAKSVEKFDDTVKPAGFQTFKGALSALVGAWKTGRIVTNEDGSITIQPDEGDLLAADEAAAIKATLKVTDSMKAEKIMKATRSEVRNANGKPNLDAVLASIGSVSSAQVNQAVN